MRKTHGIPYPSPSHSNPFCCVSSLIWFIFIIYFAFFRTYISQSRAIFLFRSKFFLLFVLFLCFLPNKISHQPNNNVIDDMCSSVFMANIKILGFSQTRKNSPKMEKREREKVNKDRKRWQRILWKSEKRYLFICCCVVFIFSHNRKYLLFYSAHIALHFEKNCYPANILCLALYKYLLLGPVEFFVHTTWRIKYFDVALINISSFSEKFYFFWVFSPFFCRNTKGIRWV